MHIRTPYAGWHAGQWRMPSFIASPCSLGRAPAVPVAASHAPTGVAGVALAAALALALAGCASAPSPTPTPAAKPVAAATPPTASPTTAATPQQASPDADHTAGFAQWLSSFSAQALEAGIRPATVRDVLGKAQWLPRVVELDRAQPEFTRTPWAYLDSAVSPSASPRAKRNWRRTAPPCRRPPPATACRPASSPPSGAWRATTAATLAPSARWMHWPHWRTKAAAAPGRRPSCWHRCASSTRATSPPTA